MKREKQEDQGAPGGASSAKHTPGPWRACEPPSNFQKGKYFIRPGEGEGLIAVVGGEMRRMETRANAELIAAAPLLAQALADVRVLCGPIAYEIADAALRAAGWSVEDARSAP